MTWGCTYVVTAILTWRHSRFAAPIFLVAIGLLLFPAAFIVPLAIFGVALALLYWKTGSLLPCIALHSINNSLAFGAIEDWTWQIAVLLPAVFVLAWSGLRGGTRNGGWAAVIGVGIFLGVAALFYTLLFVYAACGALSALAGIGIGYAIFEWSTAPDEPIAPEQPRWYGEASQ